MFDYYFRFNELEVILYELETRLSVHFTRGQIKSILGNFVLNKAAISLPLSKRGIIIRRFK